MAARAIWKAILTLGKTRVPVKLYAAIQERSVRFHILEKQNHSRIKQHMVDPSTGDEVAREQIRKGLEIEPDSFVVLSDEELATLEPKPSRDIEIARFVPAGKINHQWYERPYYLGPDGDSESYFALAAALEQSGREGVARWVMAQRRFQKIIESAAADRLSREELRDESSARLLQMARKKQSRREDVVEVETPERKGAEVIDIMTLLKRSLGQKDGKASRAKRNGRSAGSSDLAKQSRSELYERAKSLDIPGRSSMSKQQLIKAIQQAA